MPALAQRAASTSQPPPNPTRRTRPARWPQAGLLVFAVLLLHASALRGLAAPPAPGPRAAPALQVRQIVQAPPAEQQPAAAAALAGPAARSAARQTAPAAAAALPPAPAATPGRAAAAVADEAPSGPQVPTYATQPAPAATLVFEMRRGGRTGPAQLRWRPDAGRYVLDLDSTGFGPQAPGSASQGGFDAAGLAPERFVDRRRGRDQRAVNFQREGGFISFSAPQLTHPLQPGAQDRLSWMLQLSAILQANPALGAPGAQVSLWVASARGESDVWTFTVQRREALDLPGGYTEATVKLMRQPERPFDTRVEVWLDPARHHLPVQLLLALRPGGEPTELRLQSLSHP